MMSLPTTAFVILSVTAALAHAATSGLTSIYTKTGVEVTFNCSGTAGRDVTWYYYSPTAKKIYSSVDGLLPSEEGKYSMGGSHGESRLTVRSPGVDDAGEFSCEWSDSAKIYANFAVFESPEAFVLKSASTDGKDVVRVGTIALLLCKARYGAPTEDAGFKSVSILNFWNPKMTIWLGSRSLTGATETVSQEKEKTHLITAALNYTVTAEDGGSVTLRCEVASTSPVTLYSDSTSKQVTVKAADGSDLPLKGAGSKHSTGLFTVVAAFLLVSSAALIGRDQGLL